ncbi:MAG: DUF420 domain-containing protein [Myxococcota bacterium]
MNALLNALAAVLLVIGRSLARRRRLAEHRRVMIAAFCVSSLFLVSYLVHKFARDFENTTFHATGLAKTAYLALLASHVSLAMTVPVLASILVVLGLRGSFARHRRIARWAWPIWMYVSVTGVAIYVLLYHLNPAPSGARSAELSRFALPAGTAALGAMQSSLFDEKLNRFGQMRSGWKVENPSGVGYLPGGRPARPRAELPAAPASARRPDGYEALTRRPRGVSEPQREEGSEDA